MKRFRWEIIMGISLLLASIFFYVIHYVIFRNLNHIFLYLIGDTAFVFLQILLVTVIIEQFLNRREKRARLKKLSMVIGSFFSAAGNKLLAYFSDFDPHLDTIRKELVVTNGWSDQEFIAVSKRLKGYDYGVEINKVRLEDLRSFLLGKVSFLLRLLENPTLLEHESFTELLRAVFHLAEELSVREKFDDLPPTDHQHLAGDIKRVYVLLVDQWLDYMKYLKDNYPYLFSLSVRMNPFDQSASPIIKEEL
ncbi:MAG: hypothetical protein OS130_12715 [Thermodesulfobacteriota bacterium]|nr:MAG: hypothetical protein OS130_12715 [Thermodesulfobacteriota bacterium]